MAGRIAVRSTVRVTVFHLQVSLEFGSHPPTEANPLVPEGQPYYTLGAKLSRMQACSHMSHMAACLSSLGCVVCTCLTLI